MSHGAVAADAPRTAPASTLLVWDSSEPAPSGAWQVALWRSFNENGERGEISIPRLVEARAEELRARFLAWVHDLGTATVKGRRIVDHMEARPGFSYWWMSGIAQRFNSGATSRANDAIKALALEGVVREKQPAAMIVACSDPTLRAVLRDFCGRAGLKYSEWQGTPPEPRGSILRRVYRRLPYEARARLYLLWYFRSHRPRRKERRDELTDATITFVDILVHLDWRKADRGLFASNYWTSLTDACRAAGARTLWLHRFLPQPAIRSADQASALVNRFTESSGGFETHRLMEAGLSREVFRAASADLSRLRAASDRMGAVEHLFVPPQSAMNFWPLFAHEWHDSLRGHMAALNCVLLALAERVCGELPRQEAGVYLQENQPWELALVHAWKAAGHKRIIGVPHSTMRFWDLRYFYDPRSYHPGPNAVPRPDFVAVNGPVARELYRDGGYPDDELFDVEALRFQHLLKPLPRRPAVEGSLVVLVCGDFLAATTRRMLQWITAAASQLPSYTQFVLKPHPGYALDLSEYHGPELRIATTPIGELLAECDVAFTSNLTSTAADAFLAGVPVVQMLAGEEFNMSPLRGIPAARMATNPDELASAIIARNSAPTTSVPYFHLDPALPRWRRLLGLSQREREPVPQGSTAASSSP